jgi:hypothetical protein
VIVTGHTEACVDKPQYATTMVAMGPPGRQSMTDTPAPVTTVPQDLIVNQQVRTVNDALRYLPSVEVRDQQGLEDGAPPCRAAPAGAECDRQVLLFVGSPGADTACPGVPRTVMASLEFDY